MDKKETTKKDETSVLTINAPNMGKADFKIIGTAPYVQLKFPEKAKAMMRAKMEGKIPKGSKKHDVRSFEDDFEQSMYQTDDGWRGIPASSFRNAMISACRLVGFKMTLAKLSIFVLANGFDKDEGIPLVKIEGEPEMIVSPVRNANMSADLRVRAKFFPWSATVTLRYDQDQFCREDVANLLARVGMQVGIGEGRPDGKMSAGMGWGTFELEGWRE